MSGVAGTRGGRVYRQHGDRHRPRGSDPTPTDPWRPVTTGGSAWSSGTDYVAGDMANNGSFQWEAILASGPAGVGAIEPGVNNSYPAYWWCQASLFVNGSNFVATGSIPNPVPLRYRLSVGAPNYIDIDGTITYTDHQIEIQGDVTGLVIGDTVFIVPPEFQHEFDVPYHTHDVYGAYVPCRLLSTGEFVWGTV